MMRGHLRKRLPLSVLLAAVLLACLAPVLAETALPEPVRQGNVTYISGGVGLDEQQAMKAAAKNYNLAISNANKAGNFTAGVALVITARNGGEILRAEDTGPLFYASLPAGAYRVEAIRDGERRVRDLSVAEGRKTDLHLTWP